MITLVWASPVAVAVAAPSVVGVEYIPAVTPLFGAKPLPLSTKEPPAVEDPSTVSGPFDAGTVGGSAGADTMGSVKVAVGVQVVSTIEPEPMSLKTMVVTSTLVGVPVTVPVIVAPGIAARAGIDPYGVASTLTFAAPTLMTPVAFSHPACKPTGPLAGPWVKVTLSAVPV